MIPDPARGPIATIRRFALRIAATALSPLLFRLTAGKWPDRAENAQFAAAMCDGNLQIPAILRGLLAVPATRQQVSNMIVFHLMAEKSLPPSAQGSIPPRSGNALAFWRGTPISFLHFERTAGTTLATLLTEKFHPLQIATAHHPADIPDLADRKLVWGHYDLPSLQLLGPGRHIITLLREPTARILSLYYFWRSIQPSQFDIIDDSRVIHTHALGLLAFLQSDHPPIRDSIDNVYTRRLAGLNGGGTARDPLEDDPQGALTRALAALAQISFAGIVERMPETLAGLKARLGIDLGGLKLRLNDSAGNPTNHPTIYRPIERERLTPEIEAALAQLTRLDKVIYQACCDEFLQDERVLF